MTINLNAVLVLVAILAMQADACAVEETDEIAVVDFRGNEGISQVQTGRLTRTVRRALRWDAMPLGWGRMNESKVRGATKAVGKASDHCPGDCSLEVGLHAGAELIVDGELTPFGEFRQLRLELVEVETGIVRGREVLVAREVGDLARPAGDSVTRMLRETVSMLALLDRLDARAPAGTTRPLGENSGGWLYGSAVLPAGSAGELLVDVDDYTDRVEEDLWATGAYRLKMEVVGAFLEADLFAEADAEAAELVLWYSSGVPRPALVEVDEAEHDMEKALEVTARDVVEEVCGAAVEQGDPGLFSVCETACRRHLLHYPDFFGAYRVHVVLADALFEQGKWGAAALEFAWLVNWHPRARVREEAARQSVLVARTVLEPRLTELDALARARSSDQATLIEPEMRYAPIELSPEEDRLVEACSTFQHVFPDSVDVAPTLFEVAQLLDRRLQYPKAIDFYLRVIELQPQDESARIATRRVITICERLEDWETLAEISLTLLAHPEINETVSFRYKIPKIAKVSRDFR